MGAQYTVLFTPNLTQKRKKWFDGKLKFDDYHHKLKLFDDNGCPVAQKSCSESDSLPGVGETVHFARFIVEIDSIDYVDNRNPSDGASSASVAKPRTPQKPLARQVPLKRPMGLPLDVLLKDPKLRLQPSQAPKPDFELEFPDRYTHPGPGNFPQSGNPTALGDPTGLGVNAYGGEHLFVPDLPSSPELPLPEPPAQPSEVPEEPAQPLEASEVPLEEPIGFDDSEDELIDLTVDDSIVPPDSYDLPSDLESDVELVEVANKPRRSLFENMPSNLSSTGPWTKEAYLLFSWHPPVVKEEV